MVILIFDLHYIFFVLHFTPYLTLFLLIYIHLTPLLLVRYSLRLYELVCMNIMIIQSPLRIADRLVSTPSLLVHTTST